MNMSANSKNWFLVVGLLLAAVMFVRSTAIFLMS